MGKTIWTVGHSTHSIEEFIRLLQAFHIATLVDIRRYPGSRRYPHFNAQNLSPVLAGKKIGYIHMEPLGGRRTPWPNSPNTAWRNASFRGYADYMRTPPFLQAMSELEEIARNHSCAIMCSEAVWWSCHRSLVSDYLKWKGWDVRHIIHERKEQLHPYTKPARITHDGLSYRPEGELSF